MWPKSSTLHGVHQLISFTQLSLTAAGPVSVPSAGSNQSDVHPGIHTTHPLVTFCATSNTLLEIVHRALCVYVHVRPVAYSNNYQQLCWR